MPLFYYYDVIWTPSTCSKADLFVRHLPSSYHSRFPFTLTERCRFHAAVQMFKSLHKISPPFLHDIFQFSRNVTGHLSIDCLFLEYLQTMGRVVFTMIMIMIMITEKHSLQN